jgi:hypothetical protein
MKLKVYTESGAWLFEVDAESEQEAARVGEMLVASVDDAGYFIVEQEKPEWHYRVMATAASGYVIANEVVANAEDLDAAHDRLQALPEVRMVETMGPFHGRRA